MSAPRSDEELAKAAGRGDLEAFRSLVDRHRARIFTLAARMVRDRSEAEDMAQEAFIRIYRGLPAFRGDAAFATWMTRVALNTFYRYLRRRPREESLDRVDAGGEPIDGAAETADPGAGPETAALDAQTAARVRRLAASLPQPFRAAVAVFYLQERSIEEAARQLGVSQGTLKSRLFRGREMLLRLWR
ncbi:MAG: RNA polymerase sigma factor, partial [Candidatus Polarisedimenticolia bacterium]